MKLNDLFVPTSLLMFRKTTELTELRAQKDLLSSTLKQREASLEAARDDNLRLLSALSQRPKETVVSESSSSADLAGELRECQRQRDELEVYLQHVLQDMEDKTPLLESLRSNYDASRSQSTGTSRGVAQQSVRVRPVGSNPAAPLHPVAAEDAGGRDPVN